jgi:hypothetical protein
MRVLVILLFTTWFFLYANHCPCENPAEDCFRTEFYGFQYSHFILFTLLGALFPKQFWFWITLGVAWEVFEYWLSSNPQLVKRFGGCLTKSNEETPLWFRRVYAGKPKYENFIDRSLGIKNSQEHTWHYSVGDNLTNILGFLTGMYLKSRFI